MPQQDRRRARDDAAPTAPIPLEELVQDVYASSPPDAQKQMLVRLVDKVYETGPAPLQGLGADDEQAVRPADVVALVEHALHAGGAALARVTRVLAHSPSLAGSGAAAVLVGLLRRTHRRRAGDRAKLD
ncbi:MAG: hypothetical protein V4627_13425 [Pseudomonadota bacterium]